MARLDEIDRRFAVAENVKGVDVVFHNVLSPPFKLFGLLYEDAFVRMPDASAARVSEGVRGLNRNTAGGRVRFKTDSSVFVIRASMPGKQLLPHMAFSGSSGFDLYVTEADGTRYAGSFVLPVDRGYVCDALVRVPGNTLRDVTINFPIFDKVDALSIGLEPHARLEACADYRNDLPILYYGSSITQGGCVSRPGNAYQAMISRRFNCDFINLGWAGSAKGETAMAQYIADQPMCLFFMDYDHNAPTVEHLRATHERFFRIVREKNPDLPIILTTKTDPPRSPAEADELAERRAIIRETYENALACGDRHVTLIDGGRVFAQAASLGLVAEDCTVDTCHPNDLGFACMAKVFGDEIGRLLGWTP